MQEFDIEVASEFLVMAAMLLQIKSRMLLPKQANVSDEEEVDPRQLLVEMLVEYRKVKEQAKLRSEMKVVADKVYTRKPQMAGYVNKQLKTYEADALIDAVITLLTANGPTTAYVERQEYNVQNKMNEIVTYLSRHKEGVSFSKVFVKSGSLSEKVASFLAVLELLKLRVLMINQSEPFAPIYLFLRQGGEDSAS